MIRIAIDDAAWASPWRRHRVSEKALWSGSLILTALIAPVVPGTLSVGVVSLFLILGPARIRPSMVAHAMAAPLIFIVTGALSVLFSVGVTPVHAYWSWGWLSITPVSVDMALRLLAHATCGTLAVMLFALTTPMSDTLNWLVRHHVPQPLVEVASLTYRLLFIFWSTAVSLHDAQVRRGSVSGRSWSAMKMRVQAAGSLMGTLMVRSWDRAYRLEEGLNARGAEDSLATMRPIPPRSWTMVASCVVTIFAIAALCYVVPAEGRW